LKKSRINNVFTALLEINRQVLEIRELPGLEIWIQFRLGEVRPTVEKNKNNAQRSWKWLGIVNNEMCDFKKSQIQLVSATLVVGSRLNCVTLANYLPDKSKRRMHEWLAQIRLAAGKNS
jgi:hypothetical protein